MSEPIRVLYVDDEPALLRLGKLFLENSGGFSVDTVESASEAFELLKIRQFDAIISDYQMPDMDGIEFLKSVRSSGNAIPFILFTGRGREEVVIQALNEGADFYLQKGGAPEAQFVELKHKIGIAVEHRRAEEKIQALNRLYSVLSSTNKAIFHIRTKKEFFNEICRILVEMGGFHMAWIGLADLEQKIIRPVAFAGHNDGYLDTINISTEDVPRGRGPTGTAYREGIYYFSNDFSQDPRMEPWRDPALEHGYRANAAFPFALGTKNAGVLTLYAPVTGFFNEQIIDLLEELSEDISVSLQTIDDQNDRILAENALRDSEERFRGLFDTINSGVAVYEVRNGGQSGKDYIIKDFNKMALQIEGKLKSEVIGKSLFDLRPAIDEYGLIDVFRNVWITGIPEYFPQKVYVDENYSNWYENRVFRLKSGEIVAVYDDVTERKRAEQACQISESRIKSIFRVAPVGIGVTMNGVIHTINDRFCQITGYHEEELIGKPVSFLYPVQPEYDDAGREKSGQIELAEPGSAETRFQRKDGTVIDVFLSSTPIDPCDRSAGVTFAALDITGQKRAGEALRESEEKYRLIAENSADAIWILDLDLHLTYTSPSVERIRGFTPEEVMNQTLDQMVTPESVAAITSRLNEEMALENTGTADPDRTIIIETDDYCRDGSIIRVENTIKFIRDTDGHPVGVLGISHDITARKQAEKAIQESEQLFREVFDNANDGVFLVERTHDGPGNYLLVNDKASQMLGYSNEELLEMSPRDIVPEEIRKQVMPAALKKLLKDGAATFESANRRKDGTVIPIEVSIHTFHYKGKDVDLSIIRDITERKRVEGALRQVNKKLTLLSGITRHDINNKLAVLRGYLSIMEKKEPDPLNKDYLHKAGMSAEQISGMIQFTREYEKIGVTEPVWQDVRTLVDAGVNDVTSGDIRIVNDIPAGMEVFADPLIIKVFYNLTDNAVRHGGEITTVRFHVEVSGDENLIVCEDDGGGIPAVEKEKIFEREFGKNTGLGLFLSREILSITGITIRETGVPSKGARFEMVVPMDTMRYTHVIR